LKTSTRAVTVVLLLASSLTVMAGAIMAPALPGISRAFADHTDVTLMSRLVLTMPALAIALAAPLAGFATDRVGRRPVLLVSLVLYALAGSSGLYLQTLESILVGRALLGVGVAGIMTASTTLITDLFEGGERARLLGLQGAVMAGGGMCFLLIGGALADVGWRGPFAVYLASLFFVPATLVFVREPDRSGTSGVDTAALARLDKGAVAALLFVALGGMVLFYVIPVQMPFILEAEHGASGLAVGATIGIATLMAAISATQFGKLLARVGHFGALVLMGTLVAIGFAFIAVSDNWVLLLIGLAIGGFGFGMMMPNLSMWLSNLAPVRARGQVLGGLTMCVFLGQFLSPIAAGPILQAGDHHTLLWSCALGGVLLAVGAAIVSRWHTNHRRPLTDSALESH